MTEVVDDTVGVLEPVSVLFTGDSVGQGVLVEDVYECVVRVDALAEGGGPEGSLSWTSAVITFSEPEDEAVVRSRSGWNQDFVTRFFGLRRPTVQMPAELEGGPLRFGASDGRPFVLGLTFAYDRSYPEGDTVATWTFTCT